MLHRSGINFYSFLLVCDYFKLYPKADMLLNYWLYWNIKFYNRNKTLLVPYE